MIGEIAFAFVVGYALGRSVSSPGVAPRRGGYRAAPFISAPNVPTTDGPRSVVPPPRPTRYSTQVTLHEGSPPPPRGFVVGPHAREADK